MDRRPGAVTGRQGWTALGLGATAAISLAYVFNTLLAGAAVFLVYGLAGELLPLAENLLEALSFGALTQELLSPWLLVALVESALIAPLVEEMVKPLALLPLLRRLPSPREAMLVGLLAGAGFAAVENLLYAALFGRVWGGVLAVRAMGAALHPFGAGLVAAGWWHVLHGEPEAGRRWWSHYGLAVGAHALWNGTCVVAAAVAGAWFQGWEVDLLGVTDAVVLLALLATQGAGLLVALRALARRLALGAADAPGAAVAPGDPLRLEVPQERALAVWGLACLVVLLPVGLGLLRTIW
jgi:hypothetical protein